MKRVYFAFFLVAVAGFLYAGENSSRTKVKSIESRSSGEHAVYLDGVVPDQNCTHGDRAVIVETDVGGKVLLSVALAALTADREVIVRVDGCTQLNPEESFTAPKVVKLHVFR